MIGYIKGRVIGIFHSGKNISNLVVAPFEKDDLGVAYSIFVSASKAVDYSEDSIITLWTYSVVTDSDSYLIGLESKDKVKIFWNLISVSGVGPKSAMIILSILSVRQVKEALKEQEVSVFSKVPGIGKKTAAKIVLELSDKDLDLKGIVDKPEGTLDEFNDIIATLARLGYNQTAAKNAVKKALPLLKVNQDKTTAEKVKIVLSA